LLDLLPVAVLISSDRDCTNIVGNVAARGLLNAPPIQNLSRSAPEGQKPPFTVYGNGQLISPNELPMQKAAATGVPVPRSECELRFDSGERVFIAGHSAPIFDDNGEPCGSIGAFVDITHIKRLEEQNRLLTRELSHRVKNTDSIIQAISYKTIRPLISPKSYATYEQMLIAIAKAHELLFEKTSAGAHLEEVIKAALGPIIGEMLQRVEIQGPALELSHQFAHAVIMIV
jgi:two-component sensor histidine kinase